MMPMDWPVMPPVAKAEMVIHSELKAALRGACPPNSRGMEQAAVPTAMMMAVTLKMKRAIWRISGMTRPSRASAV